MFRIGFLLALSFVAPPVLAQRALVQPDAPLQSRSLVALVVGNATYRQSPLRNPANDARAMAGALTELGFAVESAVDADYKKLGASIDRFISRVRRGDVAVFYYAGHGMQIEGENYLVPTDFDAQDEASAKYTAYPADRLMEGMERSGAKLNIIILDACRNNPYRGSRAMGGGLAPMGSGTGTFVAMATSPGKTASDNSKGANGLFTAYLLESLKQPGLSLDEVFNLTREQVYNASKHSQTPWTQSNVIGRFYFHPPVAEVATVPVPVVMAPGPPRPPVDAGYERGVREARSGEAASAVNTFTQVIQLAPDNLEAYYERAMTYAAAGQFQRAIDDFNLVLRRYPDDTSALTGRAASFINVDDYDRARADLDHVIQKEPGNDIAFFDRGLAYAGLSQDQKAIDDYARVIRRRPKWPSTWYNRGIVYAASGDFNHAIADYTEAVRLRPDYAIAYANRGVAHAELGEFPKALADLSEALRLQPGDAAMLNSRGMVLLGMKEPARALKDFDQAIGVNPLLGMAYSNRAEARRALGDNTGAQADLKHARELGVR
jgi:tetratricopeptide (TPR) repeat protein